MTPFKFALRRKMMYTIMVPCSTGECAFQVKKSIIIYVLFNFPIETCSSQMKVKRKPK